MASNDPVAERVKKIADFANKARAKLHEFDAFRESMLEAMGDLQARLLPTAEECDKISEALGALYDEYSTVRQDARETRNSLGEINDELRQLKEPMAVMEAQASLDAFGISEITNKPFTVAQTANRAKVALGGNEDYQKLVTRKCVLEGQKAGAQAILADCDTALSMYRSRNRALVARLGNLTARMSE